YEGGMTGRSLVGSRLSSTSMPAGRSNDGSSDRLSRSTSSTFPLIKAPLLRVGHPLSRGEPSRPDKKRPGPSRRPRRDPPARQLYRDRTHRRGGSALAKRSRGAAPLGVAAIAQVNNTDRELA